MPMKKPIETPDPIIDIGMTEKDRVYIAYTVPRTPPNPHPTIAPIIEP